jgi:hypothetical protein
LVLELVASGRQLDSANAMAAAVTSVSSRQPALNPTWAQRSMPAASARAVEAAEDSPAMARTSARSVGQ